MMPHTARKESIRPSGDTVCMFITVGLVKKKL